MTDDDRDPAASLGSHAGIKCIAFDCFGTLFDMSGVPKDEISDYARHVRQEMFIPYTFPEHWYRLPSHPDVAEGVRRLRKNHFCVALSNGPRDLITLAACRNDFSFDHVIDLLDWRVYKPHRAAYMTVFAETKFKPEQTLMVTANPTFGDVEGAEYIGMRSKVIRHGYPNTVIELADLLGA